MNRKDQKRTVSHGRRLGVPPMVCLLGFAGAAGAQPVIVQPPHYSVPPPALANVQNNETQVFNPAGAFLNALEQINFYQWGPVNFRPSLSYQFASASGVPSSYGNNTPTTIQTISPNFLFLIGSHWSLDYSPMWTVYSSQQLHNSLNHSASLSWGTSYQDWVLGFSQSYNRSDYSLIETSAQTSQEGYSTALNASYQFNSKMSLSMRAGQKINLLDQSGSSTTALGTLASSYSWSTLEWLNYQFWPRFNAGLGVGVGYTTQASSPSSINEQYQARINWRATDKISFALNGGLEDRQYLSGGMGDLVTPIFGASVQYQPFEHTQLSLEATRSVNPGYFQNQNTENTRVTVGLNQRLLQQFNLGLTGGYTSTDYASTTGGFSTGRTDDVYMFSANLSHSFTKRGTISAFYSYSESRSNVAGSSYSSSQIGFQIGYQF